MPLEPFQELVRLRFEVRLVEVQKAFNGISPVQPLIALREEGLGVAHLVNDNGCWFERIVDALQRWIEFLDKPEIRVSTASVLRQVEPWRPHEIEFREVVLRSEYATHGESLVQSEGL